MYKLMGGDQKEYGPVSSEQVREWIAQGRANAQTLASFEGAPWKPLSSFPEFADALRVAVPPTIPQGAYVGQAYPGAQTNTMAVAGLVMVVLGTCCSPLTLVGLVLSIIGYTQIQNNPQMYSTTKVIPIIGIVVGVVNIILVIIAVSSGALDEVLRNVPR